MYYGDKQDSLVKLMFGLKSNGWSVYGYKADMSDSMTDYFDPARWDGIAVKNGFVLVVDNYSGGKIGGDFVKLSYDKKIADRIIKLRTLADNHAASKGERENALKMIEKFDAQVVSQIVVAGELPEVTYQKNPGNSKWHIEKDGDIIAKGTGVYSFSRMDLERPSQLRYKKINDNSPSFLEHFNFEGSQEKWEKQYEYILEGRTKTIKALDKYFSLLEKWNKLVAIKIGDGEDDRLVKTTQTKTVTHYVLEASKTPTDYVVLGKGWRRACGLLKGYVYLLSDDKKKVTKLTKKWVTLNDGKQIESYKPQPNKNTKSGTFYGNDESYKNNEFYYVNLEKKIDQHDEVVYIKQSKLNKKPKTTFVKAQLVEIEPIIETPPFVK